MTHACARHTGWAMWSSSVMSQRLVAAFDLGMSGSMFLRNCFTSLFGALSHEGTNSFRCVTQQSAWSPPIWKWKLFKFFCVVLTHLGVKTSLETCALTGRVVVAPLTLRASLTTGGFPLMVTRKRDAHVATEFSIDRSG